MPRLSPAYLRKGLNISPFIPHLLPQTRTIEQSIAEMKWMYDIIKERTTVENYKEGRMMLRGMVMRRAEGVPLQYVLGSQPFGGIDIGCRPGVLIPRWETEEWTVHLASLIQKNLIQTTTQKIPRKLQKQFNGKKEITVPAENTPPLHIIDLCTGTGCIPLYLSTVLPPTTTHIAAYDISPRALKLAKDNIAAFASHLPHPPKLHHANILHPTFSLPSNEVDLVTANPPYIPPHDWTRLTAPSVRHHEPRLALLSPDGTGDGFYHVIAEKAFVGGARGLVMEVGGWEQAGRVEGIVKGKGWEGVKSWGDGAGRGRVVVAWRKGGGSGWRRGRRRWRRWSRR
ncbi:modification methylase HemK [Saitoella complicata NRRL Y-17804]|uniref:modification methylase HemK n=1 Tax=Saitoella complicata (strain BCRC 22490 / CBS 7301 / JCM 7358 / NBRC 10748 / NRRL Y-17804) TaxID=698492 RepID=UPI0008673F6F|nr:modification methylase HemK [Saitoella complicata NRRL Y-17804]ODQ51887.1 modification methylase HemK [Saitoella complicata NRRL Y-17804]